MFQELGRAKIPEDPNTYLYAIARNMLAKHRQRKITEHTVLGEYCRRVIADNGPSRVLDAVSKEAPTTDAEQILRTVIARLPPTDGELVTLRFIAGLSTKQVAQRMNCSEDAIRKRIERLRAILRRLCRE